MNFNEHCNDIINYDCTKYLPNKGIFLNLGSSDGGFLHSSSITTYGLNLNSGSVDQLSNQHGIKWTDEHTKILNIESGDFVNPFETKFDFIYFGHGIEHLSEPKKAMDNVRILLDQEGKLLIIISKKCENNKLESAVTDKNRLSSLINEYGFNIISIENGNHNSYWIILCKIRHHDIDFVGTKATEDLMKYRKYSCLAMERLNSLVFLCQKSNSLIKDEKYCAVECGVANGGALQIMRKYLNEKVSVYGFDSWGPMPKLTDEDRNEKRASQWVGKTMGGLEKVKEGFSKNKVSTKNLNLIKGYFNDTIPKYKNKIENIIILRLDADWYEATYMLLGELYDKVVIGGIIIIDDFYAYIGCRKAVFDFCSNKGINPTFYHTIEKGLTTDTGGTEVFWYKE